MKVIEASMKSNRPIGTHPSHVIGKGPNGKITKRIKPCANGHTEHPLPNGRITKKTKPCINGQSNHPLPSAVPIKLVDELMCEVVDEVQRILGYTFHDPNLLVEALTHCSYKVRPTYERLEYVGDAAINLAFTDYLFHTCTDVGPGELSILRQANISTEKLARVAVRCDLYRFLRHKSTALHKLVEEFIQTVKKEIEEDNAGEWSFGGSMTKAPKVLADLVEAIAASVYVDCGFILQKMWKVFQPLVTPIILPDIFDKQPATALNDLSQKLGKCVQYHNTREGNLNVVQISVDGEVISVGRSNHRMIAKLNAAREGLKKLSAMADKANAENASEKVGEDKEVKQKLHAICGKRYWPKPAYNVVKMEGQPNAKMYVCSVTVITPNGPVVMNGGPKQRLKDAEIMAATLMLAHLDGSNQDINVQDTQGGPIEGEEPWEDTQGGPIEGEEPWEDTEGGPIEGEEPWEDTEGGPIEGEEPWEDTEGGPIEEELWEHTEGGPTEGEEPWEHTQGEPTEGEEPWGHIKGEELWEIESEY